MYDNPKNNPAANPKAQANKIK